MKRSLTLSLAIAAAAALGLASPAAADTFKLKIGAGHPASSVWVGSIKEFFLPRVAERVKAETGHTIEWTEAWGGSVCKIGECLEAVESGLLDLADLQSPFEPTKLLAFNFTYFAPFASPDPRIVAKATQEVIDKTPQLSKYLEDRYNQVFLGLGPIGNYGLVTNFVWKDVADLKGRKIAAAGPNIPWVEGTGIVPVQSNLTEAYTAMQTGVYDGWVMFAGGVVSFKLHEISKQFVGVDFGSISTTMLTINKDTFNGLPANVQKIFREVGRDWVQELGRRSWEQQQQALGVIKQAGLDMRELDLAGKAAWAKQLPNLAKIRAAEIEKQGLPGEIVYTYVKALKAAGHTFPRDWEAER